MGHAMGADLPAEAADLFRAAPDRFIAERDELVTRLRAEGRDEDAATVKALRKPTAVVWGLDQLASREPDALAALFEAGRALRAAQQAALGGAGADELLAATATRRAAVRPLAASTVEILDESGHRGATQRDAIASALEIASVDAAVGTELAAGMLQKLPRGAADLGLGEGPALTGLVGGRGEGEDAPPRRDANRLRRERDAAIKSAKTRRASADRLAGQVAELTERLERLTEEHARAESDALEAELESERASRAFDDA
jgi:hypothetical protein